VIGQFAAAIIVIVHRRQIVMHEGIRVDAFDRAGERHGIGLAAAAGSRGREAERRAHAFAAGEERISHGLMNRSRLGLFRRKKFVESRIHRRRARTQKFFQIKMTLDFRLRPASARQVRLWTLDFHRHEAGVVGKGLCTRKRNPNFGIAFAGLTAILLRSFRP
jgi:hypothetical protein